MEIIWYLHKYLLQSNSVTCCVCVYIYVCVCASQSANFMKSIITFQHSGCWHGDQLALIFHTQLSYLCSHWKIPLNLWTSHCACGPELSYPVSVLEEKTSLSQRGIWEQSLVHDAVDCRPWLVSRGWKRKLTLLIYLLLQDDIEGKVCVFGHSLSSFPSVTYPNPNTTNWIFNGTSWNSCILNSGSGQLDPMAAHGGWAAWTTSVHLREITLIHIKYTLKSLPEGSELTCKSLDTERKLRTCK